MTDDELTIPENSESVVTKEVEMLAYPPEEYKTDVKEFANELTGLDMWETRTAEYEQGKVEIDLGTGPEEFTISSHRCSKEGVKELASKLEDAGIAEISVGLEKNTTDSYLNSERDAATHVLKGVCEDLPIEISGGFRKRKVASRRFRWDDSDNKRWSCEVKYPEFESRRVLAKEENREDDDMFETLSECPCLRFKIKMEAPTKEFIDSWTTDIVGNLHKELSKIEAVGRVRYTGCTVTEQREGECYNL